MESNAYLCLITHHLSVKNLTGNTLSMVVTPEVSTWLALCGDHFRYHRIIGRIDDGLCILEEFHLLQTFLTHAGEVLLMGRTQIGKHADGRLYDIPQRLHLIGFTDTCLKESDTGMLVHQPHTEGNSDLGIERSRTSRYGMGGQQQLVNPLLHHRLTVTACNAYDRNLELITMPLSQSLQGFQCVGNPEEISLRIVLLPLVGQLLHHEAPHPTVV